MADEITTASDGNRRRFLRGFVAAGSAIALGAIAAETQADQAETAVPADQAVQQAAAPVRKKRYAMVVDLRRCVDCDACTIACKQENHTPPGVAYTRVLSHELGEFPNVRRQYLPILCNHCENPPCVPVCPVGATWKREEDGIVVVDYDKCIGCRYCMTACPYGARFYDFGENYTQPGNEFETQASHEYGKEWDRSKGESPIGNVRKCTFCLHRLEQGLDPACVQTCMPKARLFGDLNDPNSDVSRLLVERRSFVLKEELGTAPNVYYVS